MAAQSTASANIVATEATLKAKLRLLDCTFRGSTITADTYVCPNNRAFHIPKPFGGLGYTQAQLDRIEQTLASHDLELLPLDANAA